MDWPADLQLSQLQLLLRLAQAGSLSAAARQLRMTPAAASASLKRMETLLGVRLVERSTRSMRFTPEGELLRDHAERALATLAEARHLLGAQQERLEGELHIAAPSDLGRGMLCTMLDDFVERHPALRLTLQLSDAMQDLRREQIDVAIRYGVLPDSTLVARPLAVSHRIAVASPGYAERFGMPAHPKELAGHNCLSFHVAGRAQLQWRFERQGEAALVRVQGNRCASDAALVRDWAVKGLGIACKSRLDVLVDLQAGRLVDMLPGWQGERYPLHAIVPAQRHMPLRMRRLLDELTRRFAAIEGATV
jgi:molybdate transport repressor ModE-like protein